MIEHSQFTNARVPVDDQRFVKCTFTSCVLVYSFVVSKCSKTTCRAW